MLIMLIMETVFFLNGFAVVTAEFLLKHFLWLLVYKSEDIFWDSSELSDQSRFFGPVITSNYDA